MHLKDADESQTVTDPDQTAPYGAVWSWSALLSCPNIYSFYG